ncbi:hypothetical protein D3C76_1086230 [compost metagenome]
MVIDLIDPLGYQQLPDAFRVACEKIAEVGAGHQGDIGPTALNHQQVAVVGIGQGCVVVIGEVLRVRIEIGKGVVITAVQGQTLAVEVGKIALVTVWLQMGDEYLGIFQAHIDRYMVDVLPAPLRVLENRHVGTPLAEIAESTRNRGRYQDETVVLLGVVQGLDQLRQQPRFGALLGTHRIRREMRGTDLDLDFLECLHRRRQPQGGEHEQERHSLRHGRWSQSNTLFAVFNRNPPKLGVFLALYNHRLCQIPVTGKRPGDTPSVEVWLRSSESCKGAYYGALAGDRPGSNH